MRAKLIKLGKEGTKLVDTALLVIDLQRGLFKKKNKIYKEESLIENINFLVDNCRQMNIPIIFIRHTNKSFLLENSEDWQIYSGVEVKDGDLCLNKEHSSLFKEKKILREFENMRIRSFIITGLVTHGCIKAACLDGKKLGYEVKLVEDAHSNFNNNAKELIDKWNKSLSEQGVIVLPTAEVF